MNNPLRTELAQKNASEKMRVVRGYAIISKGDNLKQIDQKTYIVPSQNGNGEYTVTKNGAWECTCPDFQGRHKDCKHIHAVKLFIEISKKIKNDGKDLQVSIDKPKCPYCGAVDVIKNAIRVCKTVRKQKYRCNSCKRGFIQDKDFERMKGSTDVTTVILDLYFKGISLRGIQDHLKQFHSLSLDHSNILRRITKYSKIINNYVQTLKPEVSEQWHTDEMKIQAGGKWKWLWNVMDKETRYLVTRMVSDQRRIIDSRNALRQAKETAQKEPTFLITDGCVSYAESIRTELMATNHIRLASIRDRRINNNNIERLNGTIRDRIKTMRGMQSLNTADLMTQAYANYYNHIKVHSAIGTTPAIAANIDGNLAENRWEALIRRSLAQ